MNNLKIFCVTNLASSKLEKLNLILAGVGKNDFSNKYINCKNGDNIEFKEQYYSELTFHYWFWKNEIKKIKDNDWIGFCAYRRFWLNEINKSNQNQKFQDRMLNKVPKIWNDYEVILGDKIELNAIMRLFNNNKNLHVSSTKSSIGHLLGAAGSVEAIFSILESYAIKHSIEIYKNKSILDILNDEK